MSPSALRRAGTSLAAAAVLRSRAASPSLRAHSPARVLVAPSFATATPAHHRRFPAAHHPPRRSFCADPSHGHDPSRGGLAELTDVHFPDPVDVVRDRGMRVLDAGHLRDFGGVTRFRGPASTVRCFENNPLVREALGEPGRGRVLVVDGGGSRRCALLGDNLAEMAARNGWSGVIINGCLRDSEDVAKIAVGVKAVATHPVKSSKRDPGLRDVPVTFAGVTIEPGDWVYADMDGVIVGGKEEYEL